MRTLAFALLILPLCAANLLTGNQWEVRSGRIAADRAVSRQGGASVRLDPDGERATEAYSQPVKLVVGKTYEVSAWVKTDALRVRDLDRSAVVTGANLNMASMPWNVRSRSLGGSRDWTRLSLRFTATRADDRIRLSAGYGGAFSGRAWFDSVSIDEVAGSPGTPVEATVRTFGPAYRYPSGGWIYLHIEGEPYERGFQHGYLLAKEIPGYIDRSAAMYDSRGRMKSWENARTMARAIFQRGFDQEILTEMRGIAEGAKAAGAKYDGRAVDLDDIVAVNVITELDLLAPATNVAPTGLEGLSFKLPGYYNPERDLPVTDRCSAFAATGKATRDGKMVIGHVTWWPLTLAEQTNVMLDIEPKQGRRMLMQAYPGGVQSGTDWYQNDAGIVITETTIAQTPFNGEGTSVAYRARRAIQYSESIDDVVKHFSTKNNGLYTNEWLIGDAKTDEVAMFELGTYKTRLWRSSRNEWFRGTEGFYWGNNNAKDLDVRLELFADPDKAPAHVPYTPAIRDEKWLELYEANKGKIDESFGFLAFRTAPLVAASTMDAKVLNSEMAKRLMVWADFGKPNEREWEPGRHKSIYAGNNGIYDGGYRLISAQPPEAFREVLARVEKARLEAKPEKPDIRKPASYAAKVWAGWVLPASDSDGWLTAGLAAYHAALSSKDLDRELDVLRADLAMSRSEGVRRAARGALALDAMRRELGDEKFFRSVKEFHAANKTKRISTADFEKSMNAKLVAPTAGAPSVHLNQLPTRADNAIIVYGTVAEAGANRYAAEELQRRFLGFREQRIPLVADFEAEDSELAKRNVIFIGRPETNSALAAWAERLGLDYKGNAFTVAGKTYGSEYDGLMFAAVHPADPTLMVSVTAGNAPLETARLVSQTPSAAQYAVFREGRETGRGFVNR